MFVCPVASSAWVERLSDPQAAKRGVVRAYVAVRLGSEASRVCSRRRPPRNFRARPWSRGQVLEPGQLFQ